MPAVIFGERFRHMGKPAWHGIGKQFEGDLELTATEAFAQAGLNYDVYTQPMFTEIDGQMVAVPDRFALIRGAEGNDAPVVLNTVGEQFTPIQNATLAAMLDRSGILKSYHIETVGALGQGETIFTALQARDSIVKIAGGEAINYWTLYDGKDGGKALGLMWTPVKVVCSNTLAMGLSAASIDVRIPHKSTAEADLDFWLDLAPQMERVQAETLRLIGKVAKFKVTEDDVDLILRAAYPRPNQPAKMSIRDMPKLKLTDNQSATLDRVQHGWEVESLRQFERAQFAKDVFMAYGSTPEEKSLAGTAWGVYEAVVDVEDHREVTKKSEDIGVSALFGKRSAAKKGAFKAAMQLAGVN
jgi:phage/plasmid-like protein (TIGR03299 family)